MYANSKLTILAVSQVLSNPIRKEDYAKGLNNISKLFSSKLQAALIELQSAKPYLQLREKSKSKESLQRSNLSKKSFCGIYLLK
jgi:hypothetical protein